MPPLPVLTPASAWFWTSGADGKLRIQGCDDCGTLVHPPAAICPKCRSAARAPREVSGRATIVGFTVNAQQWLPDLPPPYVIAVVTLDESDDVRLTTNIVDVDPSEVHIGQRVQVRFEQREDVWVPLFAPTGEPDETRDLVGEPALPAPRAPLSPRRYEHDVVLSGIGRSKFGRRLGVDPLSLTTDACLKAIADAGLTVEDIDGLSTYPGGLSGGGMGEGGVVEVEEALRIHPTWINGAMDLPGQAGALNQAMLAVSAGLCRHVLCFRTVWETTFRQLNIGGGMGRVTGSMQEWRFPFGAMSAANWIAMQASQYMHRYGASREMLAAIALNGRTNAGRNPDAIYRDPLTLDDYMSARLVSTPFGLYDCDVPCDGAVAVIVSAADVAGDLPHPAVRVAATGSQILERPSWDQGTMTHEPLVLGPAKHLWTRTDLTTADVDFACLYDGFTFNAISWLEALGFCGIGEAQDFLAGGKRIALDGDLPINPHGGQLSEGRLHGFGFVYEAIKQLRHEAGDRQVANARTGVVTTGGGQPGGALLLQRADA
jgi:acetyl-CoA acetyltransferase/uncharacterized OB-fold protein